MAKTFASGESETYGYDDLHRLASVTYPTGRNVTYQYDPVGNRQNVTESFSGGGSDTTNYTYSDFNQVLSTTNGQGTTNYAWDDNGNLIGKQTPAGQITQYNYNFENRLKGILYPNGSTNAFGYDPQGIRVFKEDSQGRTNYLIDQVSVLAEYTSLGSKKAWYNSNPQRIDEILSQVQVAGKFYQLLDGLGSVTGLVNQAQTKVASYTYDVYGALADQQVQPGVQNPYLFTGRELDRDSGLQYNRARYYLNDVGSWNRQDPIEKISLLLFENFFRYSNANPIRFTDPLGLSCVDQWIINPTQYLHLGYSAMATMAAAFIQLILANPIGTMYADSAGMTLFIAAFSAIGVFGLGTAKEWDDVWNRYKAGLPLFTDNMNDLIADAVGVVLGAIVFLGLTGFVQPRNMLRAFLLAELASFSITHILVEIGPIPGGKK